MALIQRYSGTVRGALYILGNTLGLSGSNFQPGTLGNMAIFISTSPTLPTATGWGAIANTANNENCVAQWQNNSSSAILNLPANTELLYAELIWPSCVANDTGSVVASQNVSVRLVAPDNSVSTIIPDPATSQSLTQNSLTVNNRSADVTSILKAKGNGRYTVGGVPAQLGNTTQGQWAGWAFLIAYKDANEPYRNLNIYLENTLIISPGTPSVDIPVSGFITPSTGTVNARVIIAACEGDSDQTGDSVRFGATTGTLQLLSGPRNPSGNFFQSQICNNTGTLDTTGTFGNRNQPLGAVSTGVRQGVDITNISANGILPNNQTSAVFRFTTSGEGYAANGLGIQIDVNSANLAPLVKTADKNYATIGDTITYTVLLSNKGTTTASNVTFVDTVPVGTSFIPGTVRVDGVTVPGNNPNPPGFTVSDISPGATRTVNFSVTVTTLPSPNPIVNNATATYTFVPGGTFPSVFDSSDSNDTLTTIVLAPLTATKSVDKLFANIGDTITYSIAIKNTGNTTANNILFVDTIPNDTTFVSGTVKQDNVAVSGSPNPPGVTIPNSIGPGQTSTVTFSVKVNTIPNPNPIENIASMSNSFIVDPTLNNVSQIRLTNSSSIANTQVNNANLANITKYTDKSYADCGDLITYTIVVPNSGNVTALNVIFKDTIPNGTTFVTNSVYINGNQQLGANPATGVTVPNIAPGSTTTITFSVRVQC